MTDKKKTTAKRPLTSRHQHATEPAAVDSTLNGIKALAASLNDLHQQMVLAYTPIVQDIIQSGSQNVYEIEHTLDHLLTCAGHPQGCCFSNPSVTTTTASIRPPPRSTSISTGNGMRIRKAKSVGRVSAA